MFKGPGTPFPVVTLHRFFLLFKNILECAAKKIEKSKIRATLLTRRGSQVSASDYFEFWICFRVPKNKIYVFFIAARFHI